MARMRRHDGSTFILVSLFIDTVGVGIMFPVLPLLLEQYATSRELVSYWAGTLAAAYSLMQFGCAPLLGALSDRFGRRTVLLGAIAGLGAHYVLIAMASSLWGLLFARALGGASAATYSVATAYVSDIAPPGDRARRFGQIMAAYGGGFVCGPMLGGLLSGLGPRAPFYVAAVLALVNALYGSLVLPESLPRARRSPFALSRANPFSALAGVARRRTVGRLLPIYALFALAQTVTVETWVLYTHFRFGWGARENGVALFCVGAVAALVSGVLLGRWVKRLGEERLALLALGAGIASYTLYGLAPRGWMLVVVIFASFVVHATAPALQAIVSRSTEANAQGVTLGSFDATYSLMAVFGPVIGTTLLAQVSELPRTDWRVGVTFFVSAGLQLLAWILARRFFARHGTAPPAAEELAPSRPEH